jgi:hypothetical protein
MIFHNNKYLIKGKASWRATMMTNKRRTTQILKRMRKSTLERGPTVKATRTREMTRHTVRPNNLTRKENKMVPILMRIRERLRSTLERGPKVKATRTTQHRVRPNNLTRKENGSIWNIFNIYYKY